jgi:transposase
MSKRRKITEEELAKIRGKRKENKDKNVERRLKALELHAEGKAYKEIGEATGFASTYIGTLVKKFFSGGIEAIAGNNYKGNHRLLSFEEEVTLLSPFMKQAKLGLIVDVNEIKASYEKAIGRELNSSSHIYQVLKRHKMRKVMPRSKHPNKASDEVIHITKKLKQLARK